ncbi:hypothetical protein JCM10908_004802 [Rhodotorula pacifica]|uniref:pseudouridine synthase family protein n=1 Tax=Rhodotorula pacifica TaxID=1495444 RepID=UPI003177F042
MASDKRDASPDASRSGAETPSKRPRLDDKVKPEVPAAAAQSSAGLEATGAAAAKADGATGEAPSSPAPARETDSPSSRGKQRGGRGGRGGARGGRGDKGAGKQGGKPRGRDRNDAPRDGSRNAEMAAKAAAAKDGDAAEASATAAEDDKRDKLPKKKVAVLIGYNGLGYKGSQINPGFETIEGDVFKALVAAGCISEDNSTNPHKVSLARAARTDAGVHAAVNVLTLKLILNPPAKAEETSIEDHINSFLPSGIRVWSILRVTGSFDPRRVCDQRQYEYTLPTHVFLGPKPGTPMHETIEKARAADSTFDASASPIIGASKEFWSAQPERSEFLADVEAKKQWRMPREVLEQIRTFVQAYEGSHNFYNFTVGKDFRDRSCQRVMRKLEITEPFIVNDTEYISVTFIGQSFMLHQIRKMIGLVMLAVRSASPPSLIPETFGPSRIHVPKAPGLGLLLISPHYTEYNKRIAEANSKLDELLAAGRIDDKSYHEQKRDAIDFESLGLKDRIDEFKQEQVYKRMWSVEQDDLVFSKWLNFLDTFVTSDFDYLNPKGVIPVSATYKKGENPEKTRGTNAEAGSQAPSAEVAPPSDDEDGLGGDDE